MAFVRLTPLGRPLDEALDSAARQRNDAGHQPLVDALNDRRAEVHAGWGDKYKKRVLDKGKLTTRERIDRLKDPGSPIFEVGTFVNYGVQFGDLKSPGAGVVTAFVKVHDRWCVVIANDNTVASGAWWPLTPEKIERAQTIALKLRLPTVYIVDCSGLYLPEQSKSFAGAKGAGHIFKMNSLLSDAGVPQIAGVAGDCIAGGGYMPIISDRVYMTEQAYMVIAGAALIKGAKSQKMTSLDIGGPEVHVHRSGCADVRVPDDETLIACLRDEVGRLPSPATDYYRGGGGSIDPAQPSSELTSLIPVDHRQTYEATDVLARLCDQGLFWEVLPEVGAEMICGIGRVAGLYAGFVINRQGLVDDSSAPGAKRPGGILYKQGIAKISIFSRACNDDGIPLIWLQDISGFDIGKQAESDGLLAYGSNLIYTNSTNTTPMFTVLLRKASGAGYYAMAGLPYDPVVQLSTPMTRLGVMEGRTAAIAAFNSRLDDNFEIEADDPKEIKETQEAMEAVQSRIDADMDPYVAARQLHTDEIVALGELRDWLGVLVESSYQNTGHRRIKNPRIWSLHDLDVMRQAYRARAPQADVTETTKVTETAKRARPREGGPAFVAPMSGRFFVAPAPGEPPFVEVGQTIAHGQTVGLLEVMKTFNQLSLVGDEVPERAKVTAVVAQDGQDLSRGDVILELEPIAD